jgi:hypothetical protein
VIELSAEECAMVHALLQFWLLEAKHTEGYHELAVEVRALLDRYHELAVEVRALLDRLDDLTG